MVRQSILPVKLEMGKEKLTARSGLVVLYEHMVALGLIEEAKRRFAHPGSGRGYSAEGYLVPLVLMLHGGGRSLEDLREIEADEALRLALGLGRMPRACTVGDWLRRMGGAGVRAAGFLSSCLARQVLKRDSRREYTLDVDATVIEAEKDEAEWTYKKVKGYQPLLGFIAELGLCLNWEFRGGNIPASASLVGFLEGCLKKMPRGKRIGYFRSDSAGYQAEVINWCCQKGIKFSISVDKDVSVMEAISRIAEDEWESLMGPCGEQTERQVAETVHAMNRTKESFRLVVQRWRERQLDLFNPGGYCYRAIATDLECSKQELVWRHNGLGNTENYIKELKVGMGMERMPCGQHMANALFFAIGCLAYNLLVSFKCLCLPSDWRNKTASTLRWSLYHVAGKLVRHSGRLVLKVAAPFEKFRLMLDMRYRCFALWQGS